MPEIAAVAISVAKQGHEEQLHEALEALLAPTRGEAGMIQYDMHREVDNPRRFVFIERWASAETFEAHVKSSHVAAYLKLTADWLESSELLVLTKTN